MSLILDGKIYRTFICFNTRCSMSLVSDVEQLSFGSLGFSRDHRHKIRPLNAERRGICAVGSDLTVTSDPSLINTDPPTGTSPCKSLDFISPLPKFSRAPPCCSSPSTPSPLCCRKEVAGDLPVDEELLPHRRSRR